MLRGSIDSIYNYFVLQDLKNRNNDQTVTYERSISCIFTRIPMVSYMKKGKIRVGWANMLT